MDDNRPNSAKQAFLAVVIFSLFAYAVFTIFFASNAELRFLGSHNIDKIPHFFGGVFIAGVYEWLRGRRSLVPLIIIFLALTVGWEVLEFLFIGDVRYFYSLSPDLWRLDTIGDITAAALGCYGYWVFFMNRATLDKNN